MLEVELDFVFGNLGGEVVGDGLVGGDLGLKVGDFGVAAGDFTLKRLGVVGGFGGSRGGGFGLVIGGAASFGDTVGWIGRNGMRLGEREQRSDD